MYYYCDRASNGNADWFGYCNHSETEFVLIWWQFFDQSLERVQEAQATNYAQLKHKKEYSPWAWSVRR